MQLQKLLFLCCCLLSFAKAGLSQELLTVGSTSPKLEVPQWIKGSPRSLRDGKITVVEFWATWCVPCIKAIPKITELANKYKKTVDFVGISVREAEREEGTQSLKDRVRAFVKNQGAKMNYNVGMDSPDNTLFTKWLKAANRNTIPTTFVLDRDRKIAWIGFSTEELAQVLSLMDKGTPLSEIAKGLADWKAKLAEDRRQADKLIEALGAERESPKKQLALLEEALRLAPELEERYGDLKFSWLIQLGEMETALKYLKGQFLKVNYDNPMALNSAAATLLRETKEGKRYASLALKLTQDALNAGGNEDGGIYDTIAYAYYLQGDRAKAIENQETALRLAKKNPGFGPNNLKAVERALEKYKSGN